MYFYDEEHKNKKNFLLLQFQIVCILLS